MRGSRRRVWAVVAGLAVVAAVTTPVVTSWSHPDPAPWALAVAVAVGFAATERWALTLRLSDRTHALTFSELPLVVGVLALDPGVLLLARMGGVGADLLAERQEPRKVAFNVTSQWIETLVAVAVVVAVNPARSASGLSGAGSALLLAVAATVAGVTQLAVVMAADGGPSPVRVLPPMLRQSLWPAVATTAFAVAALVLAQVSWWLLWAPAATVSVLYGAYRSHVRLLHLHDRQSWLLDVTARTTGGQGPRAAAGQVVAPARDLPGVRAAGILRTGDAEAGQQATWLAGGVDLDPFAVLPQPVQAASGAAGAEVGGAVHTAVGGRHLLHWALDGGTAVLVVEVDPDPGQGDDLELTLAQLANHAAVAMANAHHAQALRAQAAESARQAVTDPLTGLPNRSALRDALDRLLASDRPFAVLLLDLDHFKEINDALGHSAGDEVLREIGRRLGEVRDGVRVLARLGGDEFAILVDHGEAGSIAFAHRVLEVVRVPVHVEHYALQVDGSVGVALHPDHAQTAEDLLTYADLAMYEAKSEKRGVSVFGAAAAGRAVRNLAVSTTLRTAIADGAIVPAYQPLIDLRTDRLVAVEALARWTHPELGAVGPDEFVRVAEQAGLLQDLTERVVDHALSWQRRWAAEGVDLQVSVNLSPRSLLDADLPRRLARAVDHHGVAADRLTVEITEESVMTDPERTRVVLGRIAELGVTVAIDDFGTGYSSLAYLQDLPAQEVKVDKSFILPMAGRQSATPLVSGIIRLCHELGLVVVAEGIERPEVQDALRGLGCDRGQGFHIARPMAAADITTWAVAHRDRWTIPDQAGRRQP